MSQGAAYISLLSAALLATTGRRSHHEDERFPSKAEINRRRQAKADAAIKSGRRKPTGKRRKVKHRRKP